MSFELKLPHESFNRKIGVFSDKLFDPEGKLVSGAEYDEGVKNWLPTHADGDFIQSLMVPEYEPGEYRRLDRAAQGRDRQQAGRLRIREAARGLINLGLIVRREDGEVSPCRGPPNSAS